jgi:hypothetical protein
MLWGKFILAFEKALKTYIFCTSIFMLSVVIYSFRAELTNWDIFGWMMKQFPTTESTIRHVMGFLFFFGAYNILICGAIGISMLFVKGYRKLGLLGLLAACSYYGLLYRIGDSF